MRRPELVAMLLACLACSERGNAAAAPDVSIDRVASADAVARGRSIYRSNCALCHGIDADGRGLRREGLARPPTNFRARSWRDRADPVAVWHVLDTGITGTAMPAWPWLSANQRWDVIAYILAVADDGP